MLKNKLVEAINRRDKLYPGKVHIVDLFNERYIGRKLIYDFLIRNELHITGNLLDFGCGSKQYASIFKHIDSYTGVDVDNAEEYGFSADDVAYYDGNILPFKDSSFHSCIAIQVIEHIFDIRLSINEINRVLLNGGYFLLTCPMTYPMHMVPEDYWRYTEYGIQTLLENSGFEVVNIERSSSFDNTMRRLKILHARNGRWKCNKLRHIYIKLITAKNNIGFVLSKNNSKNSMFPLEIMVLARKI